MSVTKNLPLKADTLQTGPHIDGLVPHLPKRTWPEFTKNLPDGIRYDTVENKDMRWLWWPYIPMGCATMLFGAGGIGKSHIACDVAARVSKGEPLPGQGQTTIKQNILILSAEDDTGAVMKPRLEKAGADLTHIYSLPNHDIKGKPFGLTLDEKGLITMEFYMQQMTATIVFIDPMVAYMGGRIDMNKMNQVRALTGALHEIAQRTESAIIMVHHSRKGTEGHDADKAAGSADFVNAARSVLYASRLSDGTRAMRHVKSNYSKEGPTLAYEFDDDHFHWTGVVDEAKLLVPTGGGAAMEKARAFILALLRDGAVPATEVAAFATDEGIGKSALERAKAGLAESYMKNDHGQKQWFWRLI